MTTHKLATGAITGLFLAIGGFGVAGAQTIDASLKGVDQFDLLIEELDDDSATCGITEPGLIKAVKKGIKGAPFSLDGKDYKIYVRVTTMPDEGNCFSSVNMQAYYYGELVLPNYPKGNYAEVALWEKGTITITITSKGKHGGNVTKLITQLTEGLVEDWRQDNS